MGGKRMDSNLILDNRSEETLLVNILRKALRESKKAKIAAGYFYLSGFNLVKDDFQNVDYVQVIMGDETTEFTKREIKRGIDAAGLMGNGVRCVKENIMCDLALIHDKEQKRKICELHNLILEGKIDFRIYARGKFHPKLYIFMGGGSNFAIIGSSNFTEKGLKENVELNIIERNSETVESLISWFDNLWENETEPFSEDLIDLIERSGILGKEAFQWGNYHSPKDLFKILAYELLDGRVDLIKEKKILALFQEIGALNAEHKIKKYYGCLIADSVGLGKSFIGSQIIKNLFYNKVDFWDGGLQRKWEEHGKQALLIVPSHLKNQWRNEVLLKNFFTNCIIHPIDGDFYFKLVDKQKGEIGKICIISYSKFTRLREKILRRLADEFDIILIDEAHRFRDEKTKAWNNIQYLKKKVSYTTETGHGIFEGVRNRFILLSATPLNNRISDLINLFKIFLDRDLRDLGRQGKNVRLFDDYNNIKNKLQAQPNNLSLKSELKNTVKKIKDEILDDLMVLRTRIYIRDSPLYQGTKINGKPLVFRDPQVKRIDYDNNLEKYYDHYLQLYEGLAELLEKLEYPYIDLFLIEDKKKDNLRILLRILLLKRIESSIFSFEKSIRNIKAKEEFLKSLIYKKCDPKKIREEWQKAYGKRYDEIDTDEEISIYFKEQFEEQIEEGKELDIGELLAKTESDLIIIDEFLKKIERVKINGKEQKYKDPKLERLKTILNSIILDGGDVPKILIFTQFIDTANYIIGEIKEWMASQSDSRFRRINVEVVTGEIDIETKDRRMKRFAPIANNYDLKDGEEIHLLVSTDALSEGVNLQDASIVVNYDLPWNPMRIVQRVGRVNRIGSDKEVYVYNFFPNRDLEELLRLLKKLWSKIEDVKNLLCKEMQILSEEEEITVDTIGEKIRSIREEVELSKLEINSRSEEFREVKVYGEDPETLQKLRIISKLMELGVSELEFEKLGKSLKETPCYTITGNDKLVHVYRVFDKLRKEKMKNFVLSIDDHGIKEEDLDQILKLADLDSEKQLIDLEASEIYSLRDKIKELNRHFNDVVFKAYADLFAPLRQGQIQTFEGVHRKIVGYLVYLCSHGRLDEFEKEKNQLLRMRQIYESTKLRSYEVNKLKELFQREGINVEKDDLTKHSPRIIMKVLDTFYKDYLSNKPDTYFGGIRTEKDLDWKVIGWYL
jgi:SNF2 family DNA or RNA helicase